MLTVALLGQLKVRLDGQPVDLNLRPVQSLLAYLLLHREVAHRRERLAGLLWPDYTEASARKNLRNTVYRLRGAIGDDYLRADRTTLAFNTSAPFQLDVARLEAKTDPSDAEALIEAVSAYQGELLPGFYEEWVLLERERLRALFERRMQQLLDALMTSGRWTDALTWAEHWIAQGQVPEPAYRALMQAYAELGDLASMAHAYQRCVQMLNEELGLRPSAETEALYQQLTLRVQERKTAADVPKPETRYVREQLLASGGQGQVYLGRDRQTGQQVIIKRLLPELVAKEPESVTRLQREGEALRQLNHPNIVHLLDVVEQEGQQHIIMEYVPGGNLRQLLQEEDSLPLERVLEIALELADALARAHHLGILHRDLKPENVLLAIDGTPRLTDFGLARMVRDETRLTGVGSLLGSPAYMSPEAIQGQESDQRSDIWSFGLLLYELLAGRHPFADQELGSLLNSILSKPVPSIEQFRPDVPPALSQLLTRMLAKRPEERLSSMRQAAAELEAIQAGRPLLQNDMLAGVSGSGELERKPRQNLPLQATPFVGREKELAELRQLLVEEAAIRLVTVLGPGGIGKTRLALETAAASQGSFADGVFFVPLAPLNDVQHIMAALADSLGIRTIQGDPWQALLHYLSSKQLLLVMDNFEHLLTGTGLVADILQMAPQVKILTTSRERLNLSGESLYLLRGMAYPETVPLTEVTSQPGNGDLSRYEAVKLLLDSARLAQPALEVSELDLVQVARISQLVQGMPLALVLAAGWLEMLSFKEIGDEIARSLDFLESEARDMPERQRSVRAAFDYSWQRLEPVDQEVFRRLAVFRGGFTRQAAQKVTGAGLHTLRKLLNKSLISTDQTDRYAIHELLRQYAEEKLEKAGEGETIREVHSHYYLEALAQREADIKGRRQLEALQEIETDLDNVRAAWKWASDRGKHTDMGRALESLTWFYYMRSRNQEGADLFKLARQKLEAEGESSRLLGRLLASNGMLRAQFTEGDLELKREAEASLAIAETGGDPAEIAFAYLALGHCYSRVLTDHGQATIFFKEGLERYRVLEDQFYIAHLLHRIGYSISYLSGLEEFLYYTRQSLELTRQIGAKSDEANALGNLGSGSLATGDYAQAEKYFREAIALSRELSYRLSESHSLIQLGLSHLLYGRLDQAQSSAAAGLAIADELSRLVTQAYGLAVLSMRASLLGDYEGGRRLGKEGAAHPTNQLGDLLVHWALATAYCGLEQPERAWQFILEALILCQRYHWPAILTWMLPGVGIVRAQQGQSEQAVEHLALFYNHPLSATGWTKNWTLLSEWRTRLEERLGAEKYRAAWERGRELDLETAVEALLAEG